MLRCLAGALAVLGATLAGQGPAEACSLAAPEPHTLDPTEQAIDTTAPTTPNISNVIVKRGRGPGSQGCGGGAASSCDDLGTITFQVTASDDRTLSAQIGYRITVNGLVPDGLFGTENTIRANAQGSILLVWIDGATDDQDDLNFDLQVRAVDLAGNLSATEAVIPIRDQGNTACGIAGRGGSGDGIGVVTVIALVLASRRRGRGAQRRG